MKKAISILLMLFVVSTAAKAQMFSVMEDSRQTNPFAPYARAGLKNIAFTYTGNFDFPLNGEPSFEFSGMAVTASFESAGFIFSTSLGNDFSGLDEKNYFDLGISFMNPFYIVRQRNFFIGIPIQLSSLLTTIRTDTNNEEFAQTNLSAGAGVLAQIHIKDVLGSTFQLIPNYGFSSASGGFIGGSVFTLNGKARINFYNVLFGKNLSVGYDYMYNSYDIDDDKFDYDFTGHSLTLGISF